MVECYFFRVCYCLRLISVTHVCEPWFIGSEVATKLGYARPTKAVQDHCKKGIPIQDIPTNGGNQTMICIPESDLYRLIIKSTLPAAEKFEEWVMEEVLPTIRKTGSYGSEPRTFSTVELLRMQLDLDTQYFLEYKPEKSIARKYVNALIN